MLKHTVATVACGLFGVALLVLQVAHMPGPAPATFVGKPLTPESISQSIAAEHQAQAYAAAEQVARRVYAANGCGDQWAGATARAAVDTGLPVQAVAGLVFVESSCNPDAVSPAGAVGLTQVNPRVWKYSDVELRNPEMNLKIGTQILASYVHRSGLREGLHRYNGLGDPSDDYSGRVLVAAYRR